MQPLLGKNKDTTDKTNTATALTTTGGGGQRQATKTGGHRKFKTVSDIEGSRNTLLAGVLSDRYKSHPAQSKFNLNIPSAYPRKLAPYTPGSSDISTALRDVGGKLQSVDEFKSTPIASTLSYLPSNAELIRTLKDQGKVTQYLKSNTMTFLCFCASWNQPQSRDLEHLLIQVAENLQSSINVCLVDVSRAHWLTERFRISIIPTLIVETSGFLADKMDERKSEHGWKIQPECTVRSFSDIVSEQLSERLQREDVMRPSTITDNIVTYKLSDDENRIFDPQLENDRLITHTLQREYNLEHDNNLRNTERIIDGNQKEDLYDEDYGYDNSVITSKKDVYRNSKGQIITNHDKDICEHRNAGRAKSLQTNLEVGDMINCNLSHKAYDALKSVSKNEKRSAYLIKDNSQYSFSQIIIDPKTSYMLKNFIDREILNKIGGCIATGKEATIFKYSEDFEAFITKSSSMDIFEYLSNVKGRKCVVKVFHTIVSEFKTKFKYIKEDYRFRNQIKSYNSKMIFMLPINVC
ncbi:hypothetical protein GJ496_007701 [Pomphorhynchus laevis]|nr:hypothetical protein GJ496_007701 [Pomphorhynchus laevis]